MARIVGTRLGLVTYTSGTDPRPGREEHNAERELIEANVVLGGQGAESARPTPGRGKALYWNESRNVLQWDSTTGWRDVSTNGGGGPASAVVVGGTSTEGTSDRSARADHSHAIVMATTTSGGAMSAADKSKLDAATSANTASRLMIRDAGGRAQVVSPAVAADIANKGYVDAIVGGAAAPVVTADNNGLATPSMLSRTNEVGAASTGATAGRLVVRDAAGRAQFAAPSSTGDAANKSYVDTQIQTHRHDAGHITTGVFSSARLPVVSSTQNGVMVAADKAFLDGASSSAIGGSLAIRNTGGTLSVAYPSSSGDAATKGYADSLTADIRSASHQVFPGELVRRWSGSGATGTIHLPDPIAPLDGANRRYVDDATSPVRAATAGVVANTIVKRWGSGQVSGPSPDKPEFYAPRSYVDGKVSRREWKTNERPLPYGLTETSALGSRTILFDYRDEDTTPFHVRQDRDELGVYVEDAHQLMPLLTTTSEDDGRPAEVRDRALIWPALRSIHELDQRTGDLPARLARIEEAMGLAPLTEG